MTLYGSITTYDGVMALIVFFTVVHGFWKGATMQIAPIMSLVLGYMIAMPMSVTTAHYFGDPPQNRLFALVTIYIGVALVVYLMVRSFRAGIEKAKLTEFDRHIGALLGFVKGILLTLSLTVILLIYSATARDLILKSESRTIAAKIINAVYPILPQALHQLLRPYLIQLKGELPLDLYDTEDDGTVNSNLPPASGNPLTPTQSNARRRMQMDDDYAPLPQRRSRSLIQDDEDDGLPPAPPPRRRTIPSDDPVPSARRRFDSAANSNRRIPTQDRELPDTSRQRSFVPTQSDEDDDPFSPQSSGRSQRR